MAGALYMGPSSAFGGAFGKPPGPAQGWGGSPVTSGTFTGGVGPMPPGVPRKGGPGGPLPVGGGVGPVGPIYPGPPQTGGPDTGTQNAPSLMASSNVLGPTAIRANTPNGAGQGFDPAYLQNLATAIGGLFSNSKQGGNVMNLNPLGNLSEISPNSGIGGNAPTLGEPMTLLQNALNGLAFMFQQPQPPTAPNPRPDFNGDGGDGRGRGGGGRLLMQ
jgi:hypothetical protein